MKHRTLTATTALAALLTAAVAHGHSVAQVQTAKRIAQSTVVLLDPQGNPTPGGQGTDTKAKIGDILSFIIQFTPVPNGATRGAGGYITEYVPPNTEVVGARIIDKDGNTLAPKRGPWMDDGWGPRGRHNVYDGLGLGQGSLSAVYADTGIFYSTDPRTARDPAAAFITVLNGLDAGVPTGVNKIAQLLGFNGPPYYAHNQWDQLEALLFGNKTQDYAGSITTDGKGNPPFGFGSAVAGPLTHYSFEALDNPACNDGQDNDNDNATDYPNDPDCASALDDDETNTADAPVGPWQRIRYTGSETGTGGITDCQSCQGQYVRVGVPTDQGFNLSPDNPLPPGTNAVRYAVGQLLVGQEYFAEISLRVTGLPLDPNMSADVNCAEVFGGDAAMPQQGQDLTWRYFLPAPSCVQLNLFFELSVDKILAVPGDTLTYTIKGKNLSVNPQTNVVVTDTFVPADVSFIQSTQGPAPTVGNGLLTWPTMTLQPGDEYTFAWEMQVTGNKLSTLNRATYTSTALPTPGFSVVALTDIEPLVVLDESAIVSPTSTSAGQVVHYTATITNNGTGDTGVNGNSFVAFTLPAGFSFCGTGGGCTAPTINSNVVPDPAPGTNNDWLFTNGLVAIGAGGGTMVIDFDVKLDPTVQPGLYTIGMQCELDDVSFGKDVELSVFEQAPLIVDAVRSDAPVLDAPVYAGVQAVTGTTSEGQGATVTVFVNSIPTAPVTAGPGGVFTAVTPTLYAGQHLNATAENTGQSELESVHSAPDVVVTGVDNTTQCNDGVDNDNDGLTDFPNDPGCTDSLDPDETDVPECSDGLDNDNDGDIDFPDDTSCSSYVDNDESGPPACNDGVDNDGDGLTDFPDDPGCDDASDVSEADLPQCSNYLDDDNDGKIDYPDDPGCSDPYDDDESGGGVGGGGVGGGGTGASGGSSTSSSGTAGAGGAGNGTPPDRRGAAPGAGDEGGWGCRTTGAPLRGAWAWLVLGLCGLMARRRQRR